MSRSGTFQVRLFYSYSHKDDAHQVEMEKALARLKQEGVLSDWSDKKIPPGQRISAATKKAIQESNIVAFLVSQDFIASEACREEWELAGELPSVERVPIILSHCAWRDMGEMAELKALPNDGNPICSYRNPDEAWQEIYVGLRALIEEIRTTFTIKEQFREKMENTDFLSQNQISLQDFFVFPVLGSYSDAIQEDPIEAIIPSEDALLEHDYLLLHGERLSGKTALCRYLFLRFIDQKVPALYLDLESVRAKTAREQVFEEAYQGQSNGDYSMWKKQRDKVIILDNLSSDTRSHVDVAMEHFDCVIVAVQTDIFDAFYRDDEHLAKFQVVKILPLTHVAQEKLIRRRIELTGQPDSATHGYIDSVENRVNEIIINNKILPRYPFYVLSILQTYEGFMPSDLAISSYGHCYYILIIAHLVKSGIARTDDEINPCFNFAEQLAFKLFTESPSLHAIDKETFENFKTDYGKTFLPIKTSMLQRILHPDYGIVTDRNDYRFRNPYMYYFFLGKFLARNAKEFAEVIGEMIEKSYLPSNRLALIFGAYPPNYTK
ncbi:toll/interleukin-1 receptor domain-containing protein [Candidatus Poribacteria bacterium]|nr:toll/interleukin-1 receptor domain-containing protein [Gammaproteobacteria bacterium]MYF98573.1 toll/interleukin-1 receptor domain-containing protein [Candidatus Poribacteria bacterium]